MTSSPKLLQQEREKRAANSSKGGGKAASGSKKMLGGAGRPQARKILGSGGGLIRVMLYHCSSLAMYIID